MDTPIRVITSWVRQSRSDPFGCSIKKITPGSHVKGCMRPGSCWVKVYTWVLYAHRRSELWVFLGFVLEDVGIRDAREGFGHGVEMGDSIAEGDPVGDVSGGEGERDVVLVADSLGEESEDLVVGRIRVYGYALGAGGGVEGGCDGTDQEGGAEDEGPHVDEDRGAQDAQGELAECREGYDEGIVSEGTEGRYRRWDEGSQEGAFQVVHFGECRDDVVEDIRRGLGMVVDPEGDADSGVDCLDDCGGCV